MNVVRLCQMLPAVLGLASTAALLLMDVDRVAVAAPPRRPNVAFIMFENLGWTDCIPGQNRTDTRLLALQWNRRLNHKYTTLVEALHDDGYATYHIGKWHLGPTGGHPGDHGFDVKIAGVARGAPPSDC